MAESEFFILWNLTLHAPSCRNFAEEKTGMMTLCSIVKEKKKNK